VSETTIPYAVPTDEQSTRWVFVRNRQGRATNVRVLRGTSIIEVLHKGERILVDVAQIEAIDLAGKSVYSR